MQTLDRQDRGLIKASLEECLAAGLQPRKKWEARSARRSFFKDQTFRVAAGTAPPTFISYLCGSARFRAGSSYI